VSAVVSVRVPKWVKERLEEAKVNVAEVVREALLRKAWELEEEEAGRILDEVAASCRGKVDPFKVAELIEESRGER